MIETPEENVKVVIRCRPLLDSEKELGCDPSFKLHSNSVHLSGREFTYDRVFGYDSTQESVYNEAVKSIINSVLEGYNGTIFAYGQTGTGKTFTQSGMMDKSFTDIFDFISSSSKDTQFLVRASYYEIYNEEIRDLLNKNSKKALELKESGDNTFYIKNLSCFVVSNVGELLRLKSLGERQRSVASTRMNERSSRSHTVFTITIEMMSIIEKKDSQENETIDKDQATKKKISKQSLRVGKLNLVDLAGSERQSKTGTTGSVLKEASQINLSLTSLSLVISCLTDKTATHIPYRNSKLTRILKDSLGGNSKTLLIACIGPNKSHIDETKSTLRFASTAKKIKNKAIINEDIKDTLLRKFMDQINELKRQLEEANDDIDEGATGGQVDHAHQVNPEVQEKLKLLENKIMFGGENLLEKAERQEQELKLHEQQLLESREKEERLKSKLQEKDEEILKIEESYGSLQEEVHGLNKKLKKVFNYLLAAKEELSDCQSEFAEVRNDLLDSIRATNKEIKLADFLIKETVPGELLHHNVFLH
jgi:kinesin family protein 3/17